MVQRRYRIAAELFRALAHPQRVRILELLAREEMCVCDLTDALHKPQAYVSQQLAVLRRAGLIVDRRQGVQVFYQLTDPRLLDLMSSAATLGERLEGRLSPVVS